MPHLIERAPTGRALCRGCGEKIAGGQWRLGERLPNPYDDRGGEMTRWYHLACAAFKRPEPLLEALRESSEEIADRERLEHEASLGVTHRRLPRVNGAERAATGRATCRACKEAIPKDAWRLSLVYYEDGRFQPAGYIHAPCATAYLETTDVMPRVRHFSPRLSEGDLQELQAALR